MAAKFVLKKTGGGQFMFNLHAANNEVILTSESYVAKQGAENGIASVRKNAPDDSQYRRETATDGQLCFVLVAENHEVIGRSELYPNATVLENGIASVKTNAPTATVSDET